MSHSQMLSPQQAFLLYQQCEQPDFCNGAEVLKSQRPVYRTPPSSSVFSEHLNDDWTFQQSPLGYDNLEAFSDVLLSENGSFGPDDLFQDLEELGTEFNQPTNYNKQQDGPLLSFDQSEPENKPKLTLKLKKVKCPKRVKSAANNSKIPTFKIVQSSFPQCENAVFLQEGIYNQTNDFSALNSGCISPSFSRTVPSVSPIATSPELTLNDALNSPELTLKDVLNLEDADMIIETSLSTYNHSDSSEDDINSRSPLSESGGNQNTSLWDNENPCLWSPASNSESYNYPSSSTSPIFDHEEVAATTYSTINYTDVAVSPTPSQGISSKRAKKPRLSQESRKIRKKEQNKQAAIRYRIKKKQEEEELMSAVKDEELEKERLAKQYNSLKQEISFMKKLMRETLIARKLVPRNAFD